MITFFADYPRKGKVLDLGCGQRRDAIALARLGYSVTGIDNSNVGIEQMNQIGQNEKLNPFKKWGYENYVRHLMNKNVERIRKNGG